MADMKLTIADLWHTPDRAALFFRHPGHITPQPAYVEIGDDGEIAAGYSLGADGAVPVAVERRRTIRIPVNECVHARALANYLQTKFATELVSRIRAGHSIEWDGAKFVGVLTKDAEAAAEEMRSDLDELNVVTMWTPEEWLAHRTLDEVWPEGMSVHDAAAMLEADVLEQGQGIDGDIVTALLNVAEEEMRLGRCHRPDLLDRPVRPK